MLCRRCHFNNDLPTEQFYYVIQNRPGFGDRTIYGMCKTFEDAKFVAGEFFKEEFVKWQRDCDKSNGYYFASKNNAIEILEVKDLSVKFICCKCSNQH